MTRFTVHTPYLCTVVVICYTDVAHHDNRHAGANGSRGHRSGFASTSFDGAAPDVPEAFLHRQKSVATSAALTGCRHGRYVSSSEHRGLVTTVAGFPFNSRPSLGSHRKYVSIIATLGYHSRVPHAAYPVQAVGVFGKT